MAKVIETGKLVQHEAQALVFGDPQDFSKAELVELETRYPALLATYEELRGQAGWEVGKICPVQFGTEEKPDMVIYICVGDRGYFGVRECMRKLASKAKDIGVRHVACGRLGSGIGNVHLGALEPVIAAAENGSLAVDIYKGDIKP